jgi:hypothetical protein
MWETFFLGTARRTESQMSEKIPGIVKEIATGRRRLDERTEELNERKGHRPADRDSESGKARGMMDRHDAEDGSTRSAMVTRATELRTGGEAGLRGAMERKQREAFQEQYCRGIPPAASGPGETLARSGLAAP